MKAVQITFISLLTVLLLAACQEDGNETNEENNPPPSNNDIEENDERPDDHDIDNEVAEDDADIEGTLWEGNGNKGVILSHGAVYDADSWEEQGKELEENGFVAFAVEDTSPEEIIEAANMLKDDYGVDEVTLLGASAGGASAMEAIEEETFDFSKAAFLSPGGDARAIDDMPVFVIYSDEEGFEDLEDAAKEQSNLEILSLAGDAHAQEMFEDKD